jgi:hypothetical protein
MWIWGISGCFRGVSRGSGGSERGSWFSVGAGRRGFEIRDLRFQRDEGVGN